MAECAEVGGESSEGGSKRVPPRHREGQRESTVVLALTRYGVNADL